jgi:hypothetical protein
MEDDKKKLKWKMTKEIQKRKTSKKKSQNGRQTKQKLKMEDKQTKNQKSKTIKYFPLYIKLPTLLY